MKNIKTKVFGAVVALALLGIGGTALANPSYFAEKSQTSSSTTTPVYMTPGTATSTLVYNAASSTSPSSPTARYKADQATLLIRFSGASPLAVLTTSIEYSGDCVDYYRDFVAGNDGRSTTTAQWLLNTPDTYSWTFASSTLNGVAVTAANGATSTAAITINTPTQCARAVFSVTGANGAVWAQWVPIKEQL